MNWVIPSLRTISNLLRCEAIASFRYVWYAISGQRPSVNELKVADRVLVNNRIVRVQYASRYTTKVVVKGIVRSSLQSGVLIFKVPAGLEELELLFCGYSEAIIRRTKLTFIEVNMDKSGFQKSVAKTPELATQNTRAQFRPSSALPVTVSHGTSLRMPVPVTTAQDFSLVKPCITLHRSYPEIDKLNEHETTVL